MALAVARFMADGQVVGMAVAAVAPCLDMLQRGRLGRDMPAANPAGHDAMQLPGDGFVHLDAKVLQTAHWRIFLQKWRLFGQLVWPAADKPVVYARRPALPHPAPTRRGQRVCRRACPALASRLIAIAGSSQAMVCRLGMVDFSELARFAGAWQAQRAMLHKATNFFHA